MERAETASDSPDEYSDQDYYTESDIGADVLPLSSLSGSLLPPPGAPPVMQPPPQQQPPLSSMPQAQPRPPQAQPPQDQPQETPGQR